MQLFFSVRITFLEHSAALIIKRLKKIQVADVSEEIRYSSDYVNSISETKYLYTAVRIWLTNYVLAKNLQALLVLMSLLVPFLCLMFDQSTFSENTLYLVYGEIGPGRYAFLYMCTSQ